MFDRIEMNRSPFPIRTNLAGLLFSFATAIALLTTVVLQAQAAPAPDKTISTVPMTFFIARGAANSCGPGCSEWIVVEGDFGVGSAQLGERLHLPAVVAIQVDP